MHSEFLGLPNEGFWKRMPRQRPEHQAQPVDVLLLLRALRQVLLQRLPEPEASRKGHQAATAAATAT